MTLEQRLELMNKVPSPNDGMEETITAILHSTNNLLTVALGNLEFIKEEDSPTQRECFAKKIEQSFTRLQNNSALLRSYLCAQPEHIEQFIFEQIIPEFMVEDYTSNGMRVAIFNSALKFSTDKHTVIEALKALLSNSYLAHQRRDSKMSDVGISLEEYDNTILLQYEDACGGFSQDSQLFTIHEKKENGHAGTLATGLAKLARSTRKIGGEVYYGDNVDHDGKVIGVRFALLYPKKPLSLPKLLVPIVVPSSAVPGKKILFLEDDANIRGMYSRWFGKEYDITLVATAEEAEPLLKKQEYGAIWSDNSMGSGMKGIQLIEKIRGNVYGKNQSVPIALYTTDPTGNILSRENELQFSYQEKPQKKESIQIVLEKLLNNPLS